MGLPMVIVWCLLAMIACIMVITSISLVLRDSMGATRQLWFLQRTQPIKPTQSIAPALAGVVMLVASMLPWLIDPLGTSYSAWAIAIDVGWQFHTAIISYGLLCTGVALYAFLVAYAQWRPFSGSDIWVQRRTQ